MPELPEIETIASGLKPLVQGECIRDIYLLHGPVVRGDDLLFQKRLLWRRIQSVRRRAKLLIMDLDSTLHLVFHLKMTGKVWIPDGETPPNKHTHLVLKLDNQKYIFFEDQRKFGYVAAMTSEELQSWDFFSTLGPEPLEMSESDFVSNLKNRKARIKSLLLDQKTVAGIGNIYADEALYLAGIHPCTRAWDLSRQGLASLFHGLQRVLNAAIKAGGSSFRDYRNALGTAGQFQENFQVYGKKGLPCPACNAMIQSEKVSNRTSCFCPNCQKEPM